MDCRTARKTLETFRENALPPESRDAMLEHLGECPSCRARLAAADGIDIALRRAMPPPALSPSFTTRLMALLPDVQRPDRIPFPSTPSFRGFAAAAAVLVLAAAGYWMLPSATPSRSVPEREAAENTGRPCFEPSPGTAVGPAYVITASGPIPYEKPAEWVVEAAPGNLPRLVVEAFPSESNSRKSKRRET